MEVVDSIADGEKYGFGSYPVTLVPHFLLPVSDGVHLALKIWFPAEELSGTNIEQAKNRLLYKPTKPSPPQPLPAILEYIPYRKADKTAARDHARHPWMCSHGYIVVRADMRGSGDSEGLYDDEYSKQEQKDGCEIISWLSDQKWCNGNVGIYGKSWAGFNGLQAAFNQPKGLKAVISLYSTDDRYASDIHRMGGCILASDMAPWSLYMLLLNASPPNAVHVSNWKQLWQERLKAIKPWAHTWLKHQTRDDYWQNGSICEDFSRVKCPVLAIGGWRDGYCDSVFRLVQNLPECRGLIGPWSHEWPDIAIPGPQIDYTAECLKWWDHHLKGINNGAMDTPAIRLYMHQSTSPKTYIENQPGYWVAVDTWTPADKEREVIFFPKGNALVPKEHGQKFPSETKEVTYSSLSGLTNNVWLSYGNADLPGDQRFEDSLALAWTTEVLDNDIAILGIPEFVCTLAIEGSSHGVLAARLCDIQEDGRSTLVTFGVLNLEHRNGHAPHQVGNLESGKRYQVTLNFKSIAYCIPRGHRLRLAVSCNYWPISWTPNWGESAKMEIFLGCAEQPLSPDPPMQTLLRLPVHKSSSINYNFGQNTPLLMKPKPLARLPKITERPARFDRSVSLGLSGGKHAIKVENDNGRFLLCDTDTVFDHQYMMYMTIEEDKPLSSKVHSSGTVKFEWPKIEDGICTEIHAISEMWADEEYFYLADTLETKLNGDVFYKDTWTEKIVRQNV